MQTRWMNPDERRRLLHRETALPLAILSLDTLGYAGLVVLALLPLPVGVSFALGLPIALAIGILFTIGHDACHQALTPHRRLNDWIGRLAFIPSIHSASLWIVGHNRIHHGSTNVRGRDYVWEPMSPEDWRRAAPWRRALYRLYRGPFGALPYYLIEMWWKKNVLPIAPETRREWRSHLPDTLFVIAANGVLILMIATAGLWLAAERPIWLSILLGWAWPFLLFNAVIGWTIYAHHTHPNVRWYVDRSEWSMARTALEATVQARYPEPLDAVSNAIMEHNAHHALPGIPFYNLREAQRLLRNRLGGIRKSMLAPRTYLATVAACKLYDYTHARWTDFDGRPTGPSLVDTDTQADVLGAAKQP
jgi:omega-6 fatty acid desaturase (delta-12 desaturase)